MYKAYSIAASELKMLSDVTQSIKYRKQERKEQDIIRQSLEKTNNLLRRAGSKLNAEEVWDACFPIIEADIFISHSSNDAELAKKLKVSLLHRFGQRAFIDSTVWGYYKNLLRSFNNTYSWQKDTASYNYERCITMANHVHAMLSYALSRMIDQTECFIFIDSDNSITERSITDKTYSPWIFHELATVHTIERRTPKRRPTMVNMSAGLLKEAAELPLVGYPVFMNRLTPITLSDLNNWHVQHTTHPEEHPLDELYRITQRLT